MKGVDLAREEAELLLSWMDDQWIPNKGYHLYVSTCRKLRDFVHKEKSKLQHQEPASGT